MLNQVVFVGRLTKQPTIKELESGQKVAEIKLAIPRAYKNSEGIYETDFISCSIFGNVAEKTCEYCKMGDLVGVKGRLESKDDKIIVVGEKVTFLSSSKN